MSVVETETYPKQPQRAAEIAHRHPMPDRSTARSRLEASRALLRSAMQAHVQQATVQAGAARTPASLAQRLSNRFQRLPLVRTAIAIRRLRGG